MSHGPYGIRLFDDLHNYLPDLIYHPEQFNNVRDILNYVTRTMQQQFNIFDANRGNYINPSRSAPMFRAVLVNVEPERVQHTGVSESIPVNQITPPPTTDRISRRARYIAQRNLLVEPVAPLAAVAAVAAVAAEPIAPATSVMQRNIGLTPDELDEIQRESDRIAQHFMQTQIPDNTVTALLYTFLNLPPPEPISTIPTPEQINNATRISTSTDIIDMCPICYENMSHSDLRRIIHCNHIFHKQCIDRWFEVNSHCPICRHDIRE